MNVSPAPSKAFADQPTAMPGRVGGGRVDGVAINLPTLAEAVDQAVAQAQQGRGYTLFTLNLDHLVKMRASSAFRAAYHRARLVSADGWPVVWLARRGGGRLERTCGADLVEPLCAAAAPAGLGLYVIGPGPVAQASALTRLTRSHPGLVVSGAETPFLPADFDPQAPKGMDLDALAARIRASGARLCLVCLGAPKQELLADALAALCPEVGFICVGAALDFISGLVIRAPSWVQRLKLEWTWRLAAQPRRLAWRYVQCAWVFARLALTSDGPPA